MPVSVAADPTNLDFPEQELCRGSLPPAPDLVDGPPRSGPSAGVPWAGLSIALHAGLVALAFSVALTAPASRSPVLISLLPSVQAPGGGDASVPAMPSAPSASPAPVAPVEPAGTKPAVPPTPAVEKRQKPKADVRARRPDPVRIASRVAAKPVRPVSVEPAPLVAESAEPTPPPVAEAASHGRESAGAGPTVSVTAQGSPAPGRIGQSGVRNGAAEGPVQARFGDADGPRFVQRVLPGYPELARRKGREGQVVLRLTIGAGGELKDVSVVEGGGHGFEDAALAAVKASSYAPAKRDGQCVECSALLPIRFALKDG